VDGTQLNCWAELLQDWAVVSGHGEAQSNGVSYVVDVGPEQMMDGVACATFVACDVRNGSQADFVRLAALLTSCGGRYGRAFN